MRLWCFKSILLASAFFTIAHSQTAYPAITDMTRLYQSSPTRDAFEVCSGGGCAIVHQVSMSHDEWQTVAHIFESTASIENTPEQERINITHAIAQFERIIGNKTNTSQDLAGTFNYIAGQLDCNDEAINTITYLRLLKAAGLIAHHDVADIRIRNYFFSGWPHSAASIRERATKTDYVVDSWFYDNGAPAVILPLATWKAGYTPTDSPLAQSAP